MEHQPYENWILSVDPLTPSQIAELNNHLMVCTHCISIRDGISEVEYLLNSAVFESPSPGFTNRFQNMAAYRKEEARRLQSYFFLGGILTITILVSIGYIATLMLIQSPTEVISNMMSTTIYAAFQFDALLHLLKTWFQYIPLPVTLAIAAGSASLVVLLTGSWIFSVWKVSTLGVKANE
ncbi:MAG TPA: hypothetical protein VF338_05235 [Leptolinea sp.]